MKEAPVGILMLDTQFERLNGDAGNPATWPFPVRIRKVKGASVTAVVDNGAEGLAEMFIDAGRGLIREEGVSAITTTCGFLVVHQQALADALPVPVATSSLLQIPIVDRLLPPGKRAGVLTFDKQGLKPELLAAAGARPDTPVAGLPPDGLFHRRVRDNGGSDLNALAAEVDRVTETFLAAHPEVGALVVECANLPTFSASLSDRFGIAVYDLVTMVSWVKAAVTPPRYAA